VHFTSRAELEEANALGLPLVALGGGLKITGLAMLVRSRSGRRALTVDVVEALAAVVALTAPLVVLWGPAVVGAEASWFTVPAALTLVFTVAGIYWTAVLCVRMGPGACSGPARWRCPSPAP
jgi:hypothetical protein